MKKRAFRHQMGAYCLFVVFFVVSSARPQDWISGLSAVPLAKIAGIFVVIAYLSSFRRVRWPLQRDAAYLLLLLGQLFAAAAMSPVWQGGAFQKTIDFSKVVIIFIVFVSVVTTLKRLRQLIFIHCASASLLAAVALWEARLRTGRLGGDLFGGYSPGPNDLAIAMATTFPLCVALMLLSRGMFRKAAWALAVLLMICVVFLTGSRGGFISFVVAAVVCLWELAVQGRYRYLFLLAVAAGATLWQFESGMLAGRLKGTFDPTQDNLAAYSSAQERQRLFWRSIEVTAEHPIFGVGPGNFIELSGNWQVTHNAFTQISSEGGVPALVLYLLFAWNGFKNVRITKKLARGKPGPGLLALAFRASLAGSLVAGCFASTAYEAPYMLVAYTTALVLIVRKSFSRSRKQADAAGQERPDMEPLPMY